MTIVYHDQVDLHAALYNGVGPYGVVGGLACIQVCILGYIVGNLLRVGLWGWLWMRPAVAILCMTIQHWVYDGSVIGICAL